MLIYLFYMMFMVLSLVLIRMFWEVIFSMCAILCMIFLKDMYYEFVDFHISSEYMGNDRFSSLMVLLSIYISLLVIGSSMVVYEHFNSNKYMMILLFMLMSLFVVFISLNLLMFYIMFEVVLIPMYLLIMGWGYQPERLYAGNYLFFYTLFASLPFLVSLIYLEDILGSLLVFYNFLNMKIENILVVVLMTLAFLVKLPMFMVHLWLPRAHVEAPISGSMLLAGVLLKMGGYGLVRMVISYLGILNFFSSFMVSIGLIGGVLMSLLCLRQIDLKSLIAYSSVVHMGLLLCGIFSFTYVGICGAVVLMVGHGLCSSGLFFLASVVYNRLFSRSMIINKGLMMMIPSVSLVMFLMVSSNMAAPPSLNLMGEVLLIISVISWHSMTWILMLLVSFFSGAYSVYLFSVLSHGNSSMFMVGIQEVSVEEYLMLFLHWAPLNLFLMKSGLFLIFL